MRRAVYSFAGVIALYNPYNSPYSCHKPTSQEYYARNKHCFAALDANLKIVSPARLEQAGYDPHGVESASTGHMNSAFDTGKPIGMSPRAIYKDLEQASTAYQKSHSWQSPGSAGRKFTALRDEVHDCLLDYYGRPND